VSNAESMGAYGFSEANKEDEENCITEDVRTVAQFIRTTSILMSKHHIIFTYFEHCGSSHSVVQVASVSFTAHFLKPL